MLGKEMSASLYFIVEAIFTNKPGKELWRSIYGDTEFPREDVVFRGRWGLQQYIIYKSKYYLNCKSK